MKVVNSFILFVVSIIVKVGGKMSDGESKKELTEEEKKIKELIEEIIFFFFLTKEIEKIGKTWKFRTLNKKEHVQILSKSAIDEDEATVWMHFKIETLKMALVAINKIDISEKLKETVFDKFPPLVINGLFEEYDKMDKIQLEAVDNLSTIRDFQDDFYSRVRYKVMRATGALPTEQRVKDMNEHQWFWYYYNLLKDERETEEKYKSRIDYISFFINQELSTKIRKYTNKEKNGDVKHDVVRTEAHDEVNPNNPNIITHYGDTTVDEDFEKKLSMVIKEE